MRNRQNYIKFKTRLLPFDVLPQATADGSSETLAWWEHLSAALLIALVGYGLMNRQPKC